jgi:hypothetical protein
MDSDKLINVSIILFGGLTIMQSIHARDELVRDDSAVLLPVLPIFESAAVQMFV